ncbi:MAG TPA: NAD-binding protein [Jatrophihabitantaceae bacterium]
MDASGDARPTVVVAGNDRLLLQMVTELEALGEPAVFIVPADQPIIARDATNLGARVIIGDPTDPEVLSGAGVATAEAFAIVGVGDDANAHTAFAAAGLNPAIRLVVRFYNLRLGKRIEQLFDDCVVLSASAIAAPLFVEAAVGASTAQPVRAGGHWYVIGEPDGDAPALLPLATVGEQGEPVLLPSTVDDRTTLVLGVPADGVHPFEAVEAAGRQLTLPRVPRRSRPLGRRVRAAGLVVVRAFDLRVRLALLAYGALVLGAAVLFTFALDLDFARALYFTITSVTSIGYSDISLTAAAGWVQVAAAIIMVLAVLVIALLTAAVVNALVSDRLRGSSAGAEALAGHLIVCGFGTVGQRVVELVRAQGWDCAVIERSPSPEALEVARSARLPLITGDVTDAAVLRLAGLTRARALIAVTSDDITNIEAGMGALSVTPDIRVVLRLGESNLAVRASRLRLTVSRSVSFVSAPVFAAALLRRSVIASVPAGRRIVLLAEVRLEDGCDLVGVPVSAVDRPGWCRVFGLAGEPVGLPDPARMLTAGDVVLVAATRAGLSEILVAAGGPMPA